MQLILCGRHPPPGVECLLEYETGNGVPGPSTVPSCRLVSKLFIPLCFPRLFSHVHPTQVHPNSAKPFEVMWRPYDSAGIDLAENAQRRIALLPRLYVDWPDHKPLAVAPGTTGKQNTAPAGSLPCTSPRFTATTKTLMLNIPPIGSWTIVGHHEPWGDLGPFAF